MKVNKTSPKTSIHMRHFIYSKTEQDRILKVNPNTVFGNVIVNGSPKIYTSIIRDSSKMPPDGVILISGDLRDIRHTPKK